MGVCSVGDGFEEFSGELLVVGVEVAYDPKPTSDRTSWESGSSDLSGQ